MALIELTDVSYRYPISQKWALMEINQSFEQGQIYGIIGSNESGKTTFSQLLIGLIPQFYQGELVGEVYLEGESLREKSIFSLVGKIGYVFQNPFNQLSGIKETVFDELAYGLENLGIDQAEMIQRIEAVIALFQLEDLRERHPFKLSGGQQQKVAFAATYVMEPDIFVLDEPTAQLDPASSREIYQMIGVLKARGKTVFISEQMVDLLAPWVDELLLLDQGKVSKRGSWQAVISSPEFQVSGVRRSDLADLYEEIRKEGKE